jgi:glyoxylase-like metal-dependent hydrolase (beta-lactamase superfamily II)
VGPVAALAELGIEVLERGWLSSNNVLFLPRDGGPGTVVDTGYALHAPQTGQLLQARLGSRGLARVVNTHLHSDHCGGNANLQSLFGAEIAIPVASFDAVRQWDPRRLTFDRTDQRCDPFVAQVAIEPGEPIRLGDHDWIALATPGHDPEAVVFFQPDSRVLIAGDALWQDRLAIVFPELAGKAGFAYVTRTLDLIESLQPRVVIPGHGPPFVDVAAALAASRYRLASFVQAPERHLTYALRALVMFHMLEHRERTMSGLVAWMLATPILTLGMAAVGIPSNRVGELAQQTVTKLLQDGALVRRGTKVRVGRERRD